MIFITPLITISSVTVLTGKNILCQELSYSSLSLSESEDAS
jgi:hypothetical protein